MTDRDVRDLILRAFEGIAERHGVARSHSHACALELIAALTGHGVRLVRPAHLHDPAADWRRERHPGDQVAGARAARAALYGTGTCPICRTPAVLLTRDGALDEHELPDDTLGPVGCVGAGLKPAGMLSHEPAPTTPNGEH
jgi:hypothetical protein